MNLEECVSGIEVVVLAVPSQAVRETAKKMAANIAPDTIIINAAKGLEMNTHKRLSQVIQEEIPHSRVAVLSGPSHAEEVGRGMPTTGVCSSEDKTVAELVQDVFMSPFFRVYTNQDLTGVETGGALKNIIAIAAGISDGLGYGDNTKAALMTRGATEMARLGQAMGASILTFAGLTGIGDLIVTCTSMHSRNRRAGILLGQGKPLKEVLQAVGMVVEGVDTCKAAYELAQQLGVEMPITEQLYQILFKGKDPALAVNELMLRDKTHESEDAVNQINMKWL